MATATAPSVTNPYRKVINVMATPVAGAIGWGVEKASNDAQLATSVATLFASSVMGVNEYLSEKHRPKAVRIEEARRGEAFPNPAVVMLLVAFGILMLENLIGLFVGVGLSIGQALAVDSLVANGADRNIAEGVFAFTQSDQLLGVMIALTIPLAVVFGALGGVWGGHRIRSRGWLWLMIATALVQAVNALTNWAVLKEQVADVSADPLLIGAAAGFGLHAIGIAIGLIWVERNNSRFVLGQLFRRLDPEDREALLEAASPEYVAR